MRSGRTVGLPRPPSPRVQLNARAAACSRKRVGTRGRSPARRPFSLDGVASRACKFQHDVRATTDGPIKLLNREAQRFVLFVKKNGFRDKMNGRRGRASVLCWARKFTCKFGLRRPREGAVPGWQHAAGAPAARFGATSAAELGCLSRTIDRGSVQVGDACLSPVSGSAFSGNDHVRLCRSPMARVTPKDHGSGAPLALRAGTRLARLTRAPEFF